MKCELCWFRCKTDRSRSTGRCGIDDDIYVAHYGLHTGEEPYLTGDSGSGTVFFAGCTLRCTFCQNYQISRWRLTSRCIPVKTPGINGLADIFFELKNRGASNINLVSPTPYVPGIIKAVTLARSRGFDLPFIYNTHGYDTPETIESLAGIIDIYLPDMKYGNDILGEELSSAPRIYTNGKKTLTAIYSQAGRLEIDRSGKATRGTAVRHLVLPGNIENSLTVLDFLESLDRRMNISLMSQYHPCGDQIAGHPELNRTLYTEEYDRVVQYALSLGFSNLLIQEIESHDSYLPDFSREKVFDK